MTDPTHDARRPTDAPEGGRRWLPTYLQLRLGALMLAIVLGVTGMSRHDSQLVKGAMIVGGIGIVMRFLKPKRQAGS